MQLYLDTANIEHIRYVAGLGFISGITTNPSLLAKEDPSVDIKERILEIHSLVGGHLSVEVNSIIKDEMVREAEEILHWFPQATIKVPIIESGLAAVYELSRRGIPTNVTLVFNPTQAIAAANAGATYVSVFMGRLDDVDINSEAVLNDICNIWDVHGFESLIIAASIRSPMHITQAALAGADIATVPYNVLMQSLKHPLTDKGVQLFIDDHKKMIAAKKA
jgi:transaldolase